MILGYYQQTGYYKVRYNNNDEEELTPEEIQRYLKPLKQGEYRTENQSGQRRRSKRIEKLPSTNGYTNVVQGLDLTWYNLHKQSTQEYKHFANTVIDEETGRRLEYRHLIEHPKFSEDWLKSGANELYRLFQGSKKEKDGSQRIKGTNTLFLIKKDQVPENKKATYTRVVVDKRPEKEEVNRTRLTVGGDGLKFQGNTSTETAGLETSKMTFNSVISTLDTKFTTINISNMYLNTPLQEYQYMRFSINMVPQEVIDRYNLHNQVTEDGYVFCEIRRAIYGLKESEKLANIKLQAVLAIEEYKLSRFTHGLYKNETRDITF